MWVNAAREITIISPCPETLRSWLAITNYVHEHIIANNFPHANIFRDEHSTTRK